MIVTANFFEYEGDLLQTEVDVIAHQTNCTSTGVSGLAAAIFSKHPVANGNLHNPDFERYGTVELIGVKDAPYIYVANVYAQVRPGRASDGPDTAHMRLMAFAQALGQLAEIMLDGNLKSVGFPKHIGCNLAGGNWVDYRDVILVLAEDNPEFDVHIVEKKG